MNEIYSSTDQPLDSRRLARRTTALWTFLAGTALMAFGGILAFVLPIMTATSVFMSGVLVAMLSMLVVHRLIGPEKLKVDNLDEYELGRHLRARSAAMTAGIASLGILMFVLLCMPLLAVDGMPTPLTPWPEMVRGVGMIAGALMFVVCFVYLRVIVSGLNADERALSAM